MKIALVSPYDWAYPGGVANHIEQMSKEFKRNGHSVTVIAPSSKSALELGTPGLVTIGRPIPLPTGGSIARITLSFHRGGQVRDALERGNFDVIHVHEPLVSALPLTVLRYSTSVNVATFHAYRFHSREYMSLRPLLVRWFRRLHGKIAVSKPAADMVSKYFPGYYNIIPNGIDTAHFSAQVEPIERFKDGKVNILFVGRMEKRKGLQYLLAAYARMKWEYPNTRLIVVGPGKMDAASERILGERALKDVEFMGPATYAELPRYYRTADIFCSPATGAESFGIVLLEAMASGTAVVASNIPGYATVVKDGAQGLLVEPKNDQALADALITLANSAHLRRDMGLRGRAHAMDFSWEKVASRVMEYYRRLLETRAPGRLLREE